MQISLNWQKYLYINVVLLVLLVLIPVDFAGRFIIAFLLMVGNSLSYGQWLTKSANILWQLVNGLIALNCLLIIVGAILIFFYKLTAITIALSLLIAILIPLIYLRQNKLNFKIDFNWLYSFKKIDLALLIVILTIITTIAWQYWQAASNAVIFSPWQLFSPSLFWLYGLATILTILYTLRVKNNSWLLLVTLLFLVSVTLGVSVYELGFGFDPVIHEATTDIIYETGSISPKPLYYLGQYSLIINWHWLFNISIAWLNQWLVPLLFATALPIFIFYVFKLSFQTKPKLARLLPLILLSLPYSIYTITTPQSMANLLFLILLLLAIIYINNKEVSLFYLWLIALASLSIHPIAGIPALIFTLLISIRDWRYRHYLQAKERKILFYEIYLIGLFVLPILFLLNSLLNGFHVSIKPIFNLNNIAIPFTQFLHYTSIFDLVYLINYLIPLILIILLAYVIYYLFQNNKIKFYLEHLLIALLIALNYLFFKFFVHFDWLISYEKQNYTDRLLNLLLLAAVPFILMASYLLIAKVFHHKLIHRALFIILISILISSSFYLSYPRRDPYQFNKSLNPSALDYQAVRYIDDYSDRDYLVLANQAVAAAALNQFGFKKYYQNNLFYYPLPTSAPLYQLYLDLSYQRRPIANVLLDVQSLANSPDVFYVINDYWTGFEQIIKQHKKAAADWQVIGNHQIYIFYYNLASNNPR